MFSREILAERVPRILRRRYKELAKFDVGERPRLGIDQPRVLVMAAKDAPPPVTVLDASENLLRAAERFERVDAGWDEDMDRR